MHGSRDPGVLHRGTAGRVFRILKGHFGISAPHLKSALHISTHCVQSWFETTPGGFVRFRPSLAQDGHRAEKEWLRVLEDGAWQKPSVGCSSSPVLETITEVENPWPQPVEESSLPRGLVPLPCLLKGGHPFFC